jgi:hypothetical protein
MRLDGVAVTYRTVILLNDTVEPGDALQIDEPMPLQ